MPIDPQVKKQAEDYIKAIRNSAKHAYALAYFRYLIGTNGTYPVDPTNLSYMAAQAVRMHLSGIVR